MPEASVGKSSRRRLMLVSGFMLERPHPAGGAPTSLSANFGEHVRAGCARPAGKDVGAPTPGSLTETLLDRRGLLLAESARPQLLHQSGDRWIPRECGGGFRPRP